MTTAAPTMPARLTLDSSDYESGLNRVKQKTTSFESSFKSLGSNLANVGRSMTVAFTAPILLGANSAAQAFIGLDLQMRNIQSITGITDAEAAKLSQTFVDMSTDLTQTTDSADKLAEAFYFITSAGFSGSDALTVLKVATKAATAGLTDTNTAGTAILATLNAYGMGAEQAGYVSDVLFKTVDKGVLTFSDLSTQLGDIVGTGSIAGVGIDQLGAAMSVLTRHGITASEAVTALNQLMLQFISPSKKQKDAAEAMGIELSVATLRSKGLAGALQEIIEKGGGTDALLTLFGDNVRALKGALALGGDGIGEFTDMLAEFENVGGRTEQAFAKQTESVTAQLKNFKNEMTSMGLELASIFIPVLLQLLPYIKQAIEWFKGLSPEAKKWIVVILAIVAVIGPLIVILGGLATAIGSIIALIGMISLPLVLVVLVIALIIGAIWLLYQMWTANVFGIQQKTQLAFDAIRNIFVLFFTWVKAFANGELGLVSVLFSNFLNFFKSAFQLAFDAVKIIFQLFVAAFRGDWYKFGELLRELVNTIGGIFINFGLLIWHNLVTIFTQIKTNIRNFFNPAFWQEGGKNLVQGIIDGVQSMFHALMTTIGNLAQTAMQVWSGFWGIHSPSVVMDRKSGEIMAGAINGVVRSVPQFASAMQYASTAGMAAFTGGLAGGHAVRPTGTSNTIQRSTASLSPEAIGSGTPSQSVTTNNNESKIIKVDIHATVRNRDDVDYLAQQVAKRIMRTK